MVTQHRAELDLITKLDRVEKRSRQDRGTVFNNLGHLINLEMLGLSFHSLDGSKAVGIDGMTKEKYGENLDENLSQLLMRIRTGSYHPQASRIVEIPKSDGSKRPLAIACFEDKIVQESVRRILERIYEPLFLDCSHGFRPERGCHTALIALNKNLMSRECGAVLEIDLRKYFNTIPHRILVQMLESKISDQRFLRLIIKLLKAPTINEEGVAEMNEVGSPQGSILSPLLANLYLHHALDIWFTWINESHYGSGAQIVRYADDGVFTFRTLSQAEQFRSQLESRLVEFGISINESKTKALICGQNAAERCKRLGTEMPSFTFLGFLHVWGTSVNRKTGKEFFRVKRRTCPIRFKKKLAEIKADIRKNRHKKDLVARVKRVTQGYLNYFAINDNQKRISQFVNEVKRMLFKYLNRRSQRKSFNWTRFAEILRKERFPEARIQRHLFFNLSSNRINS
jgi:group II intron reverse transcriptase/maturase